MPDTDSLPGDPRSSARRCPACGSTLHAGSRHCEICGEPVPWRLTPFGAVGESVLIILVVAAVTSGLLVLRARGGPGLSEPEQIVAQLPGEAPTSAPTFTALPPPSPTLPPNTSIPPTATPLPRVITYTVASGDTLSGISQQFNVSIDELMTANQDNLDSPHNLHIGQQLAVPVQPPPSAVASDGTAGEGASTVAQAPGEGAAPAAEGDAAAGEAAAAETPVENATLEPAVASVLGLPAEVAVTPKRTPAAAGGAAALAPVQGVPGEQRAADVIVTEKNTAAAFAAPVAIGPAGGADVSGEAPLLRWSSVGLLPQGAYYVVSVKEADAPVDVQPRLVWVLTNATATRVPAEVRPPLGTSRTFEWTVSVRRRTARIVGTDRGELLSPRSEPRTFVWAP